ncbi:hypothetical protein MRB53_026423 [Persea americana]|uniref:Uncharacterized protein n=1 Tax=Persea americana TaxID=3435 RepID=A0ACC2LHY3_PERAE|nr:hypothetical protein MRB53_026423 [Persea americana]
MEGKSFALNLMEEKQAAVHKEDSNTMLWHRRLGHIHHTTLLFMKKNNLGEGLPELEEELPTCAACQHGKQTRLHFPQNKAWRATQKLQLVHTDVGGPQKTPSLNGSKFYIAFIDDHVKRDKLDKKVEPGIFVGYSSVSKAYRMYLPQNNIVIVSMDVQFFESDRWSWENDKKLEFQEENADIDDMLEFQEENDDIDDELVRGTRSLSDIYQRKVRDEILVVSLYVDDLLMTRSTMEQIDTFKKEMKDVYEMTDLGKMTFFLGMEVKQKHNETFICQHKYAKEILKKFNMEECKPAATPMNQKEKFCKEDGAAKVDERLYRTLIGCLMYLTATRPDIMNVQEVIAQSTSGAEYVAAAAAVNQALWIRKLMVDLHMEQKESTQILVDSQAAISIANNPVFHGKTKHFKLKLYFLRDVQKEGEIQLIYCKTENQNADILTKALPKARIGGVAREHALSQGENSSVGGSGGGEVSIRIIGAAEQEHLRSGLAMGQGEQWGNWEGGCVIVAAFIGIRREVAKWEFIWGGGEWRG